MEKVLKEFIVRFIPFDEALKLQILHIHLVIFGIYMVGDI